MIEWISTASAAIQGTKSVYDWLINRDDLDEEVKAHIVNLGSNVLELQSALLQARVSMDELTSKLEVFEDWQHVKDSYTLTETQGGAIVYTSSDQPQHFVCPACFESQSRHILQDQRAYSGNFKCPKCNESFLIKARQEFVGDV